MATRYVRIPADLIVIRYWRSIETAPKDGTAILVFGNLYDLWQNPENRPVYNQNVCVAAYLKSEGKNSQGYWHWGAPGYIGKVEPTHWMPLPDPPEEKRSSFFSCSC